MQLKKSAAIFFLVLYLCSTTEASQLLKLPVVFEHFREHKLLDHSISPLQFLALHYLHGSPRDNDYDRDMQLPFKTHSDCLVAIAPAFIPKTIELVAIPPIELPGHENYVADDQVLFSAYLSRIWQPPRQS